MRIEARELDQLVRDWCLGVSRDETLFQRISERALTQKATSFIPCARALHVLRMHNHPPRIQTRIEGLGDGLETFRLREWQVDDLGNMDNEPQALFDILGEEVATLGGFDPERLRQARLSGSGASRAEAAGAFLESLGWDRLPAETAGALRMAVDDLKDRERYDAWGLFVERAAGTGWALGIQVVARETAGQQVLWSEADKEVQEQARMALELGLQGQGWEANIEWPATYVGESIGLPLYVAALVTRGILPRNSLIGSTGRLSIGGQVTGVSGIKAKIDAAYRVGIRRVLVPRENLEEARMAAGSHMTVIPISHVNEVTRALRQSVSSIELSYSGLIRLVRASIPDYGLAIKTEVPDPNGHRVVVANAQGTATIWIYRNGRVRTDGGEGSARDAATRLIREQMPAEPQERDTLTFQLPTRQLQERFCTALEDAGAVNEKAHEHEIWRLRFARGRSRATVVLYSSGKCVVQGTAPAWDEAHTIAQNTVQSIGALPKPRESSPSSSPPSGNLESGAYSEAHIGTDEAGKGDYFGPLVCAAVLVDPDTAATLQKLGVRDSKTLSDKRVKELANQIRQLPSVGSAVTTINPRKFNELYEEFRREGKNLNSLLAWGHARSIDNLLTASGNKRARAKYVVVDQFADKHYIEQRTRRAGIPIRQRHKAEADIAVAAASVLARDGFLQWIERWSERTQIRLAKGASPQVVEAGKAFVQRWGAKWLGEVAKLNFRTTQQVLEGGEPDADDRQPDWVNDAAEISGES